MRAGRPGARVAPWAILALFLLAGPLFADQAADLLTTGKRAFGDGHYSLAVESFRRVSIEFPESPVAEEGEYLLGVSLFYGGSWQETLDALAAFGAHRPGSGMQPRVSYWMAAASLKLGRFDDALCFLRDHLAHPGDPDPYRLHTLLAVGIASEALGRDTDAAAAYAKILSDSTAGSFFPEATYRLAGAEYRAGRYTAARDLYSRLLLKYPESPFIADAVFFLAECSLALGSPAEADKGYRSILSLYPDSPWREAASFRLADVAWRRKQPDQALELLASLQARFPGGAWQGSAFRLGADIQLARRKYQLAVEGYTRALKLLKDPAERQSAWYSLGVAQLALGRKKDAAESFAGAGTVGAGATGEKASWERALLLADDGNEGAAIQALQAFLQVFPSSVKSEEARRLLASLLEKTGRTAAALAAWDSLVNRFPRSKALSEYLFRRGSDFLSLDRPMDALDDFQRVVRDFPDSPWRRESAYSIGYVYDQRGEYPRALPWFQSVAQDPKAGDVGERSQLSAGICLFNMGSFDKAVASLQALRARNPKTIPEGTIALYVGRALYRGERLPEAAQQLAQAAQILEADEAPGSARSGAAEALYWLGWSHLRMKKFPEARDAFLAVADRFPASERSQDALLRAGICETLQGNDEPAAALFDRLISTPGTESGSQPREQALYEQFWAYRRLGRQEAGEASLARLVKEFPTGTLAPQAIYKAAEQALRARSFPQARAGFQRVARDFPSSALGGQAMYWSAETDRQSGDLAAALEGYWACVAANAGGALLDSVLSGYQAALTSLGDPDLAARYAEKARKVKGIQGAAVAGIELGYAELLLASSPADFLAVIDDVRRRAPPEPYAGEASLLTGKYYAATQDWGRATDIFSALEGSRVDEIGARAAREHARALESTGQTSEAVDEYLKIAYQFPDYPDIAAEGLFNAVRLARARGEQDRAARLEQTLRKSFPSSPWVEKLEER
jgi:TolA-binding protein